MALKEVQEFFENHSMEDKIIIVDGSSATVAQAAQALGTHEQRIAKTLAFKVGDENILIVMAGDAKIDNQKYKSIFAKKAKMLSAEEVVTITGHPVGGVCPFGLADEKLIVYLDESLKRFETVFPACGSPNSAIELKINELEKYSNFKEWINVSKL